VVFTMQGRRFEFIGPLRDLVAADRRGVIEALSPEPSRMADVKNRKSGEVATDLGLKILDGFLQGFQISGALPAVSAEFQRAMTVSFTFANIVRRGFAPSAIGGLLMQETLEIENPVLADLARGSSGAEIFIVDSVIVSNEFAMTAERTSKQAFKVNAVSIADVLDAGLGVAVASRSGRDVTFSGTDALPFAFTCRRASLDASGRTVSLKPYKGSAAYARPGSRSTSEPRAAVLSDDVGLLEWSEA
jgi:hypothetical protein